MKPQPKHKPTRIPHRSKAYKRLQQSIVERDNSTCRVCGRWTEYLNGVHHVKLLSAGGSDVAENMVLLCLDCHPKFHNLAVYRGKMVNGEFTYWEI